MPWVPVSQAAAYAVNQTATNVWTPFPGGISVQAGQQLFLAVSADNTNSSTPTFTVTKPVGETAEWVRVGQVNGSATGGASSTAAVFGIIPDTDWSSFVPVVTIQSMLANPGPAVANWIVFEGGSLLPRITAGQASPAEQWFPYFNGNPTITAASVTLTGYREPHNGDLCLGLSVTDSGTIPSLDADTTNGAWVDAGAAAGGTTGGAGTTGQQMRMQYKLPNARGAQTLDPANAEHTILICLAPAEGIQVVHQRGAVLASDAQFVLNTESVTNEPGDVLLGSVGGKPFTSVITTPSGFTLDRVKASGNNATGAADTGSPTGQTQHKIADGSEADPIPVSVAGEDVMMSMMTRIRAADPDAEFDVASAVGSYGLLTTPAVVTAKQALDFRPGDVLIWHSHARSDAGFQSITAAITGCTGVNYALTGLTTTNGTDSRTDMGIFLVETGTVTAAPTVTAAVGTNAEAVVAFWRVRKLEAPATPVGLTVLDQQSHALTFGWTP